MNASSMKRERQKLGISQLKLASIAGVSRFKLQMFEYGYGELTEDEKQKIAAKLKRSKQ